MKDLSNENVIHIVKDGVQYLQFRRLLEYSDILVHAYSLGIDKNFRTARAKNAEYRMALLSNTTFEFLVKYISDNRKSLMNSEYLFTKLTGKNKGEPLDADSVYSMLKRLSKKTDINSHPHQLRHYFAEERRKEGWDLNDIRFALGHKKVETTIKYLGENNERLIEATDQYYSNNEDLYQIADFL